MASKSHTVGPLFRKTEHVVIPLKDWVGSGNLVRGKQICAGTFFFFLWKNRVYNVSELLSLDSTAFSSVPSLFFWWDLPRCHTAAGTGCFSHPRRPFADQITKFSSTVSQKNISAYVSNRNPHCTLRLRTTATNEWTNGWMNGELDKNGPVSACNTAHRNPASLRRHSFKYIYQFKQRRRR